MQDIDSLFADFDAAIEALFQYINHTVGAEDNVEHAHEVIAALGMSSIKLTDALKVLTAALVYAHPERFKAQMGMMDTLADIRNLREAA